jgi:hypothetical protein
MFLLDLLYLVMSEAEKKIVEDIEEFEETLGRPMSTIWVRCVQCEGFTKELAIRICRKAEARLS